MSCDFHAKRVSPKPGDIVRSKEQARGLLVGSIVTAKGHAWQRYVHGWRTVGREIQMQTDELLKSGYTFLPVKVLVAGDIVVHGLDCTCVDDKEKRTMTSETRGPADEPKPPQPQRPKPWERDPYRHRGRGMKIRIQKR